MQSGRANIEEDLEVLKTQRYDSKIAGESQATKQTVTYAVIVSIPPVFVVSYRAISTHIDASWDLAEDQPLNSVGRSLSLHCRGSASKLALNIAR